MLTRLRLHRIRCFRELELALDPARFTLLVGGNAQGKTTLLESVCVLLRLQSPRASGLRELIEFGSGGAAIEGDFGGGLLRVVLGDTRRMQAGGEVCGRSADYLKASGLVVWMGNDDIQLVRGGPEGRRRFLDFCASQTHPGYLAALRGYERALRARNHLLRSPRQDERSLDAYAEMLARHGEVLRQARASMVGALAGPAADLKNRLSVSDESLSLAYIDGAPEGVAAGLERTTAEERRRGRTVVGPHRDDLGLELDGRPAGAFASEGQQRGIALALKLAQAKVLEEVGSRRPLVLIDDIFGELDPMRRRRLLDALPSGMQTLAATTSLSWLAGAERGNMDVFEVAGGSATPSSK